MVLKEDFEGEKERLRLILEKYNLIEAYGDSLKKASNINDMDAIAVEIRRENNTNTELLRDFNLYKNKTPKQ